MTYAQKDYSSKLGNSDHTIAEAGSLLVAFANLLAHFDININPETLASKLQSLETDPAKLTWGHISQAFPEIGVFIMKNGSPEYSDSIVVFNHNNRISYAAVADAQAGTIIDSFDGEEKDWDLYGSPKMFVTYVKYSSLEVTPLVIAAPAPEPVVETTLEEEAAEHTFDLTKDDEINPNGGIFGELEPQQTIVPVKRISETPEWKMTLKTGLGVIETFAKEDVIVHDLDGQLPDVELKKGTLVYVAARFVKDDHPYYRTVDSTKNDAWYGIPAGFLSKTENQEEQDLDQMLDEISLLDEDADEMSKREKLIKAGATAEGKVLGIFKRNKKDKEKA